jgi:hypothetical protein
MLTTDDINRIIKTNEDYLSALNKAKDEVFELDNPESALANIYDEVLATESLIRDIKSQR